MREPKKFDKTIIDRYCLECGESVDPDASRCDYCGSDNIDEMEIPPEE